MSSDKITNLQPLKLQKALLYFFIPALLIIVNVNIILPKLDNIGIPIFWNYMVFYSIVPMTIFLIVSLMFYRIEKKNSEYDLTFKERFRFEKMTGQDYLWILGLFLFMLITAGLLSPLTAPQIAGIFPPPEYWPDELNPLKNSPSVDIPLEFLGQALRGNWWVLGVFLISLTIATLGEEFWWRGYMLPRQELAHGKYTWIIHGILWDLFHIFLPWNLIALLPGTLALAYVAQKRQKILPVIIAHWLVNGLLIFIVLILGILG